jgi:hypothetical protein
MSNMPALSEDAIKTLIYVDAHQYRGRGPALDNTKARRELKKLGLIYSRPINDNPLLPAASGNRYQWRCTGFAAEIAQAYRRERDEADLPTYSDPGAWNRKQVERV